LLEDRAVHTVKHFHLAGQSVGEGQFQLAVPYDADGSDVGASPVIGADRSQAVSHPPARAASSPRAPRDAVPPMPARAGAGERRGSFHDLDRVDPDLRLPVGVASVEVRRAVIVVVGRFRQRPSSRSHRRRDRGGDATAARDPRRSSAVTRHENEKTPLCGALKVGRGGLEPPTSGLRVLAVKPKLAAANGISLQNGTFRIATKCHKPPPAVASLFTHCSRSGSGMTAPFELSEEEGIVLPVFGDRARRGGKGWHRQGDRRRHLVARGCGPARLHGCFGPS
jgi:hypothetical protein